MSDDASRHLVIDAGPIIGAIDARDTFHDVSSRGLRVLLASRTRVLIPLPIFFEVYKRVAYRMNVEAARMALDYMRDAFELHYFDANQFHEVMRLLETMPWWGGSLEDATVALLGLQREVPVWTFNYRDLRAFPNLQFWSPG
jgi:hypothetical protein